jgi:cytochrome c oxidase subunit 2
MSSSPSIPSGGPAQEPNHALRFTVLWLTATVIAMPLVIIFIGPILAPGGTGSDAASSYRSDMTVLAAIATPIILLVALYLLYAVAFFRQPQGGALEGPAVRGDARIQTAWLIVTSLIVLGIAAYGTVRLEQGNGAGSGSGPNPLTSPSGPKLPVQVIAQQWLFSYRYPTYGGVETTHLVLPVDEEVEFHVTSLDVIHSFWAYQLGVKADANPGVDNIAFVKPTKVQAFNVRCAELCGIWHGYMRDTGHVVSQSAFNTWIHQQQTSFAPATKVLPKYSKTYLPEPTRRGE